MSQEELEAHVSHGPRATIIAPGVTLFTKDGSNTGNAIIIKQDGHTSSFPGSRDYIPIWLCETDFGNRFKISSREIELGYWLGYQQDYDKWWDDRLELIKRGVEP